MTQEAIRYLSTLCIVGARSDYMKMASILGLFANGSGVVTLRRPTDADGPIVPRRLISASLVLPYDCHSC